MPAKTEETGKKPDRIGMMVPKKIPLLKPQHDGLRRPEVTK